MNASSSSSESSSSSRSGVFAAGASPDRAGSGLPPAEGATLSASADASAFCRLMRHTMHLHVGLCRCAGSRCRVAFPLVARIRRPISSAMVSNPSRISSSDLPRTSAARANASQSGFPSDRVGTPCAIAALTIRYLSRFVKVAVRRFAASKRRSHARISSSSVAFVATSAASCPPSASQSRFAIAFAARDSARNRASRFARFRSRRAASLVNPNPNGSRRLGRTRGFPSATATHGGSEGASASGAPIVFANARRRFVNVSDVGHAFGSADSSAARARARASRRFAASFTLRASAATSAATERERGCERAAPRDVASPSVA